MTKKKFKELRMLVFCGLLFIVFMVVSMMCFINKETSKAIIMLIGSFVTLLLLIGRYNIILFDDSIMIYDFKIIAMLPVLIEYKHIKEIEKKNNHKVLIKHKRRTHVYVLNSDKFIESLNKYMK